MNGLLQTSKEERMPIEIMHISNKVKDKRIH